MIIYNIRNDPKNPVLITVPHAGSFYPELFKKYIKLDLDKIRKIEDYQSDKILKLIKKENVDFLIAKCSRAVVDLNRSRKSIDNDMFNGHGEYHYKSGMKYIGNFENDEFDGLGTLSLGANCIERGKFQKGKRVGKFYQMDNNEYYLIVYNNDKMERFEKIMRERIPEDKFPKF